MKTFDKLVAAYQADPEAFERELKQQGEFLDAAYKGLCEANKRVNKAADAARGAALRKYQVSSWIKLRDEESAKYHAMLAARTAVKKAATPPRVPVGTTVIGWKRLSSVSWRSSFGGAPRVFHPCKPERRGVVQLLRPDSPKPAGRRWVPEPGTPIVRHLRKDGTEALTFDQLDGWSGDTQWFAEGEDPNKQETAK